MEANNNSKLHLNFAGSKKIFEVPLNYVGDVTLHWMIDYETEEIQYEIHYPLGFAKWFAFGFSDYGELAPADYCILWANWKNELYFEVYLRSQVTTALSVISWFIGFMVGC